MNLAQLATTPKLITPNQLEANADTATPALYRAELETTLLQGDCLTLLDTLPEESVHSCITSPPYYLLRHYEGIEPTRWPQVEYWPIFGLPSRTVPAWEGCLGEEPSLEMYIGHLVLICRKIKRVLRGDGTFWLNLGDKSANTGKTGGGKSGVSKNYTSRDGGYRQVQKGNLTLLPSASLLPSSSNENESAPKPQSSPQPKVKKLSHKSLF